MEEYVEPTTTTSSDPYTPEKLNLEMPNPEHNTGYYHHLTRFPDDRETSQRLCNVMNDTEEMISRVNNTADRVRDTLDQCVHSFGDRVKKVMIDAEGSFACYKVKIELELRNPQQTSARVFIVFLLALVLLCVSFFFGHFPMPF